MAIIPRNLFCLCVRLIPVTLVLVRETYAIDENGYIVYSPSMGDFSIQAETFLGALSFAKKINRTLVLPPFITEIYIDRNDKRNRSRLPFPGATLHAELVPFSELFRIEPLESYHRVVELGDFLEDIAPDIWPQGKRKVYCGRSQLHREVPDDKCVDPDDKGATGFWEGVGLTFDKDIFYKELHFHWSGQEAWADRFPAREHPVLALVTTPSIYPISRLDLRLQRYMEWAYDIQHRAHEFMTTNFPKTRRPSMALQFETGDVWDKFCDHILESDDPSRYGRNQCLGQLEEHGVMTYQICYPSVGLIVNRLREDIKTTKTKTLFLGATQETTLTEHIRDYMRRDNVRIVTLPDTLHAKQLEMAIMEKADYFIGNCVSATSGFVARARFEKKKKTEFWGIRPYTHQEL